MRILVNRLISQLHLLALPILFWHTSVAQDKFQSLEAEIRRIVKDTKAVGVSIALIDNYDVVWAKGFGVTEAGTNDSVTTQTLFQAASISKSVTALAVIKKVQENKIDLDENIDDQLTSWHIPKNNYTKSSPVTVQQLLSHTGGVANSVYYMPVYKKEHPLPNIIESLNGTKPALNDPVKITSTPGTKFSYSNCGYWILEALLEDVEKRKFQNILADEILSPIGMANSTFHGVPSNAQFKSIATGHLSKNFPIEGKYYRIRPQSSGGLWSTPTDLARLIILVQNPGKVTSMK